MQEPDVKVGLLLYNGREIDRSSFVEGLRMDMIKEFYDIANTYCRFISENKITVDSIPSLMELLMKLYISAANLPETEPETIERLVEGKTDRPLVRIGDQVPQFYWEVSDPFVQEDSVCGDVADDLSDIFADLQIGIKEFESGRAGNAAFEWKLGLNNHWGNHVVGVLRVLHAIRNH